MHMEPRNALIRTDIPINPGYTRCISSDAERSPRTDRAVASQYSTVKRTLLLNVNSGEMPRLKRSADQHPARREMCRASRYLQTPVWGS